RVRRRPRHHEGRDLAGQRGDLEHSRASAAARSPDMGVLASISRAVPRRLRRAGASDRWHVHPANRHRGRQLPRRRVRLSQTPHHSREQPEANLALNQIQEVLLMPRFLLIAFAVPVLLLAACSSSSKSSNSTSSASSSSAAATPTTTSSSTTPTSNVIRATP